MDVVDVGKPTENGCDHEKECQRRPENHAGNILAEKIDVGRLRVNENGDGIGRQQQAIDEKRGPKGRQHAKWNFAHLLLAGLEERPGGRPQPDDNCARTRDSTVTGQTVSGAETYSSLMG